MTSSKLTSHPEIAGVVHLIEVVPATKDAEYPQRISDIDRSSLGSQTEMYCPVCDALLDMPSGSVTAYIHQHLDDLGGENTLVEVRFHHKGPRPANPPQRYRRVDPKKLP